MDDGIAPIIFRIIPKISSTVGFCVVVMFSIPFVAATLRFSACADRRTRQRRLPKRVVETAAVQQVCQMPRQKRLGQLEDSLHLANTERRSQQQVHNSQPRGVRQGFEQTGQSLHIAFCLYGCTHKVKGDRSLYWWSDCGYSRPSLVPKRESAPGATTTKKAKLAGPLVPPVTFCVARRCCE